MMIIKRKIMITYILILITVKITVKLARTIIWMMTMLFDDLFIVFFFF